MASSEIETKIKYFKEVMVLVDGTDCKGWLYVRKDYHEDGSDTTYFGVELGVKEFDTIAGTDYQKWETKT